jgi:hypothetical protein
LVHKAFGGLLRKYDSPRRLADLWWRFESEFRRVVGAIDKIGKMTAGDDGPIERHDGDNSSAQVASMRTGDLDPQNDIRAGVDLAGRRPTQCHADWMRRQFLVNALELNAHAIVRGSPSRGQTATLGDLPA